jgi:integrase
VGVVTRKDSKFYWLNLERAGLPALREKTRIVAKGLPEHIARTNRRLAEDVYHARMADLARHRAGLPVERARVTFRFFAAWYLEHITPTKRTADRERSAIAHLVTFFGRRPLDGLDQATAREYQTHRRKAVKPATINRELDVLKSMLTAAVPTYLERNPLQGMGRLRAKAPQPRVLTHAEETRLLAVMTPANGALLIAALDTLIRLSDLMRLKWAQDHGTHLEVVDPKAEPYQVPVSKRLRAALDALPRVSDYVFGHLRRRSTRRPGPGAAILVLKAACAAAGVPHGRPDGMTFHGLRHTGATRALAVPGTSLRDLMTLGGWRDVKSVVRYTRPTRADQALVDAMSRARPVHVPPKATRKTQKNRR